MAWNSTEITTPWHFPISMYSVYIHCVFRFCYWNQNARISSIHNFVVFVPYLISTVHVEFWERICLHLEAYAYGNDTEIDGLAYNLFDTLRLEQRAYLHQTCKYMYILIQITFCHPHAGLSLRNHVCAPKLFSLYQSEDSFLTFIA